MSNKKAKDILKKLGYNKYYEHIPFIKDKLGINRPYYSFIFLFSMLKDPVKRIEQNVKNFTGNLFRQYNSY